MKRGSAARLQRAVVSACLTIAIASGVVVACASGPEPVDRSGGSAGTSTVPGEDFAATAEDFTNIHDMTPVRGFFVDNKLGHLDEALAIAEANEGGTYPVGTIIQLVPQEAMVKRRAGWSPATKDWEFFFLDVTEDGTTIVTRGSDDVVNRFGGNCADCHLLAEPEFDFVCEDDHGCDPLPIDRSVIDGIQLADPRPRAS